MNFEERISHRCGERAMPSARVFGNSGAADLMRDSGRRPLCFAKVVLEIGKGKLNGYYQKYGDVIRQKTETDPQKALRMFRFGFEWNIRRRQSWRTSSCLTATERFIRRRSKIRERCWRSPKRVSGPISSVRWRFSVFRSESHIP